MNMKLITVLVLLACSSWAAEITYQVTNDAGEVVTSGKVETNDATLAQIEVWRIEQLEKGDGEVTANVAEVLKKVLVTFIHGVLNQAPTSELEKRLREYEDTQKAIKDLVWQAAH